MLLGGGRISFGSCSHMPWGGQWDGGISRECRCGWSETKRKVGNQRRRRAQLTAARGPRVEAVKDWGGGGEEAGSVTRWGSPPREMRNPPAPQGVTAGLPSPGNACPPERVRRDILRFSADAHSRKRGPLLPAREGRGALSRHHMLRPPAPAEERMWSARFWSRGDAVVCWRR